MTRPAVLARRRSCPWAGQFLPGGGKSWMLKNTLFPASGIVEGRLGPQSEVESRGAQAPLSPEVKPAGQDTPVPPSPQ